MTWNPRALPDQAGRVFVVTGGTSGLGYFTVEQLASTGARVILAARDEQRAQTAMAAVRERMPQADLGVVPLDLSSLDSVRGAVDALGGVTRIDGLVLNAGLTHPPARRAETADGNELLLATNHLGHFALVAGLLDALDRAPAGRIVGLGSIATRVVLLARGDLQSTKRYRPFRAYAFSKHAVHGFVFELDRRLRAVGSSTAAVLAHPGYALDGLTVARAGIVAPRHPLVDRLQAFGAQGKNRGAAPTVRALLDPSVSGGDFIGPAGMLRGRPRLARPVRASASMAFGRELWAASEKWTGVDFPLDDEGRWPLAEHQVPAPE